MLLLKEREKICSLFSCAVLLHTFEEDFQMKLANRIITFVIVVALLFTGMGTTVQSVLDDVKLGLDLQGGFEVLYEVETIDGSKVTEKVLADTSTALGRRVNDSCVRASLKFNDRNKYSICVNSVVLARY